jgi:RNA polymerase sigma-70 factor (ECF subfamily)
MEVTVPTEHEFQAWVAPHLPALRRYASRIAGPERDDVLQEALLRAWSRWSTYDAARGEPVAWLIAIVRDRARRARPTPSMPVPEATTWMTPADVDLERAVARLSDRQRQAVDLYYFVDLDVAAIAQVMECAPGTVKATLSQARARLRELLGDGDD